MNKTVLVVDDDVSLRMGICESLSDEGYVTVSAGNGQEALSYLRNANEPPCMILLDLMMPVMNGWQFREAQQLDPALAHIPVVVITANGSIDRTPIEADEILMKPFELAALLRTAARLCPC